MRPFDAWAEITRSRSKIKFYGARIRFLFVFAVVAAHTHTHTHSHPRTLNRYCCWLTLRLNYYRPLPSVVACYVASVPYKDPATTNVAKFCNVARTFAVFVLLHVAGHSLFTASVEILCGATTTATTATRTTDGDGGAVNASQYIQFFITISTYLYVRVCRYVPKCISVPVWVSA